MMPSDIDLRRQARAYAARGWAVLPLWWPSTDSKRCACRDPECGAPDPTRPGELLGSPAKHPLGDLVPNGKDQATTDPDVIERWWSARPNANIGLRTGSVSGLLVLDVDGPVGQATLHSLIAHHGRFHAVWVRTARAGGGWHAYFAHPGRDVPSSSERLGPKLDTRGDGGYVAAPPSLHANGQRYRWLAALPRELPPAPAWMLELLVPPPPPPPRPVRLERGLSPYVTAAVEREAHKVAQAPAGQRNNRLNVAAWRLGQLVGAGLVSEGSVTAVLLAAAAAAGLAEHEARATVRSGLGAGIRHPRAVAAR